MKPTILCVLTSLTLVLPAAAGDWPSYRGPDRDGHARGEEVAESWGPDGPPELWRVPVGDDGYSSITVADGRVFTMSGQAGSELTLAFDARTGKRLWSFVLGPNRRDGQGGGPRATPTVDGDSVYVVGANGKLFALGTANGRLRWSVDLVEELGADVPQWGVSTSPLVWGDLLLLDVGGSRGRSVAAFEKATGNLRWASQDGEPGYSSPIVIEAAGARQALFFTGEALVSVAPTNGEGYWRVPWRTSYDVNAAMPIFVPPDGVFISSAYDTGAALYRLERRGNRIEPVEVWRSKVMRNHFNSSVLVDGHLYGFDNATLKCVVAATGAECWAHRGFGKGSLIAADGFLIVFGEQGQLALVRATPEGYREVAQARPFRARTWAQPALADGVLYLRSQREMVALDVAPRKE